MKKADFYYYIRRMHGLLNQVLAKGADSGPIADNRIKLLNYDESDVYTITTRYGYQTNIVFGAGEEVQTISVGDRSMWQIIPAANRLFIRPMEDNAITNMTVITNRHSYQFDLKSISTEKGSGNIYVAKFVYPDAVRPAPAPRPAAVSPAIAYYEPPPPGITGGRPSHPNYNYTFSGPDNLAPQQVYDDGKSTHIKYREGQSRCCPPYTPLTPAAGAGPSAMECPRQSHGDCRGDRRTGALKVPTVRCIFITKR